jgi:electron transfer flavoprotein beta subunit
LKLVVTVKQVPDPNTPPKLESDLSIDRDREVVLDPGDECGVELGLQLREADGGEVVLISMGPPRARDAIRKGLSMGADRGILISDEKLAGADAFTTAMALFAAIKPEAPDLVICATESYDGSSGLVPPMLAELLEWPLLSFATAARVEGGSVVVERQEDEGRQTLEAPLPCVIAATAAIASPRYASLKGIMGARSKPLQETSLADLGIDLPSPTETLESIVDVETRRSGEVVEDDPQLGVDKVLRMLREARVL